MRKPLPTLGVLGAYTGVVLKDGGFSEIHEVLDHLYPGIMTLGCAAMAETASREIGRQHPEFADMGEPNRETFEAFAAEALRRFGPTIEIDGPHGTGKPDMKGR